MLLVTSDDSTLIDNNTRNYFNIILCKHSIADIIIVIKKDSM